MSNLLSQASLVMIPSGYKEDVVYSQIPTSGAGDLSFTRASNGTRVNSAGLVEVCPWNLLQQSETIGVSPWAAQNSTVTTNATTAPNGTSTAEKIIENTSNGYHQVYQEIFASGSVVGQDYTFSCYAKASERTKISLALQTPDISVGTFDLINGTASISGLGGVEIESVGNGWYRCSIYRVNTNTGYIYGNLQLNDGTVTQYTGDGTSGTFVWGAQLNIGSTAKPYFPTTDRLNVPRLTYQNGGGGCPSLLLEKQSTNLCLYSEQFDNAAWTKTDGTVTANQAISPDGTQNADKCVGNNGVVTMDMRTASAFSITSGSVYTWSLYVKKAGYRYCQMTAWTADDPITIYDLDNGVVVSELGPSHTSTITSVGNGWYRITITRTASDSIGWLRFSPLANSTASSAQNGTDGFYIWGAQVEASSYVTSYIVSTSSSATRVADECSKTGISSLIGQTSGTIFWDINFVADGTEQTINISDGTNFIYLQKYIDNKIYTGVYDGSFVGSITSSVLTSGRKKIAFGYILNSLILYINGVSIGTDLTSTIPTCDRLSLTVSNTGSIETNNFILFPTKLTNAELASLTTI